MKVLGISDEVTTCECCGRTNLKKTVALDNGNGVVRYGTECAARAMGRGKADVEKEVKAVQAASAAAAEKARSEAAAAEYSRWAAWLSEKVPGADVAAAVRSLGGFSAARAAYKAA
jgi:hypothetical protein